MSTLVSGPAPAVACALAGAACFGLGSAAQQRAAVRTAGAALVREPAWLGGLALIGAGLTAQVTALGLGPVTLVQPIGVLSVVVAALAARRMSRDVAVGALACAAGPAAFLLLARPGEASGPAPAAAGPAVATAVVLVAALGWAVLARRRRFTVGRPSAPRPWSALAPAVAGGVFYGVCACLLKVLADAARAGGPLAVLTRPALGVACVIGPVGFVLSQVALRRARSAAPVVAALTTVDPLVAVVAGVTLLGERIATGPAALAGQVLAALVAAGGVLTVARAGERSPHTVPTGRNPT